MIRLSAAQLGCKVCCVLTFHDNCELMPTFAIPVRSQPHLEVVGFRGSTKGVCVLREGLGCLS